MPTVAGRTKRKIRKNKADQASARRVLQRIRGSKMDVVEGNAIRMTEISGSDYLIRHLAARGVETIFGVPGGDCSLDLIESASRASIDFVLARTESAAAIMASVTAELHGTLGVVLTTRGPGLANAANGIAYASLDRAPLVVIADGYDDAQAFVAHQRIDQAALLAPLVKGALRLDAPEAFAELEPLLDAAQSPPHGPVYVEVAGQGIRAPVPHTAEPRPEPAAPPAPSGAELAAAREVIAAARRPVIIAGLQAREAAAARELRALAERLHCPVYSTYKAKGCVADASPYASGPYIGGAAERPTIETADLIIAFGADPVEFPPQPWPFSAPVLEITAYPYPHRHFVPAVALIGDPAAIAREIGPAAQPGEWTIDALLEIRSEMRRKAGAAEKRAITPQGVVQTAQAAAPEGTRVTVDAGAHMLSVLALWIASAPNEILISRGLATMGFALPAAVGAALADKDRLTVAMTGDGGLMMCAAELATAAQHDCRLTVIVFNDTSMTLIGVKQRQRQLPTAGVDYSPTDFAAVARGFGCQGYRVETLDRLGPTLEQAFAHRGPTVVDVVVDPHPYHDQIRTLRG